MTEKAHTTLNVKQSGQKNLFSANPGENSPTWPVQPDDVNTAPQLSPAVPGTAASWGRSSASLPCLSSQGQLPGLYRHRSHVPALETHTDGSRLHLSVSDFCADGAVHFICSANSPLSATVTGPSIDTLLCRSAFADFWSWVTLYTSFVGIKLILEVALSPWWSSLIRSPA